MKSLTYKVFLVFPSILLLFGSVFAQNDSEQGIKLYNQSDFKGAIALLKNSNDVKGIYYLGLANEKIGESGKAKDAFKKAFAESYDLFFEKIDEWQKIEPLGSVKTFSELLQETKDNNIIGLAAAEKAFSLKSEIFQFNEWRIKAKVLLNTTKLAQANEKIYPNTDKSVSNAKITERQLISSPKYSDGAPLERKNQSPNKPILIKILAVFGADGKIKLLMPMDNVIDSYTAQVINGIEKYKFQTANKDSKPVTYHIRLQYSFSKR